MKLHPLLHAFLLIPLSTRTNKHTRGTDCLFCSCVTYITIGQRGRLLLISTGTEKIVCVNACMHDRCRFSKHSHSSTLTQSSACSAKTHKLLLHSILLIFSSFQLCRCHSFTPRREINLCIPLCLDCVQG